MADDSIPDLGPTFQNLANLVTTGQANAAQLAAYQAVIQNLQARSADYSNLKTPQYQQLQAQQLGPSALAGIQSDAQSRGDQQAAITQLGDISKNGGLELSDRNALNQLEQTTSRNNQARNNSLANQFAARGQLGSGAQLAMSLANNQNAAMNANQHGENIAADAQKRAMQAVLDKASASRSMSNDDYARKKSAAEAADSIARFNATMKTDTGKYNNSVTGQGYEDQLKKLQGQNTVTGQLNSALLGQGNQKAAGIVGQGNIMNNGLIPGLSRLANGNGNGGAGNDPGLDAGGQADLSGNRGGPSDLSGGGSLASGDNGAGFDTSGFGDAVSDPSEWESFAGDV